MKMIPTARFLQSERNKDWSTYGAVSELIDNSLGADRGNADTVWITWDDKKRILKVEDNGRGLEQMGYLFRYGSGTSGSKSDIGKYGQGGSAAILWLADLVKVWSVRNGQRAYARQDVHNVVDINCEFFDITESWTPHTPTNASPFFAEHNSGTAIHITLRKGRRLYSQVLQKKLGLLYAPALRHGKRIIWTDEFGSVDLKPYDPGMLIDVEQFDIEVQGMRATVKAGLAEKLSRLESGMSVTFGHRQIFKEYLSEWDGGKLFGWIDLSEDWHDHLTNNKTDLVSDELKEELMAAAAAGLSDLLALLEQEADRKFAASLQMEANLKFGEMVKKLKPRSKPEPKDGNDDEKDKKEPKPPKPPKPGDDAQAGVPIEVKMADPDELSGRWLDTVIHDSEGSCKIVVRMDPESELIAEARKTNPVNMLLLRSLIASDIAGEIVRQERVVEVGLYPDDEWAQLKESTKADTLMLSSFVFPKMYAVIGEVNAPQESVA